MSERITIRFRLEKEDLVASRKLIAKRQPLFWLLYACGLFLPFIQSKQTLESLKASPETELTFTSDGIQTRKGAESVLGWKSVHLEENSQVLHLLNQQQVVLAIVPKRAFHSPEDLATIRSWAEQP